MTSTRYPERSYTFSVPSLPYTSAQPVSLSVYILPPYRAKGFHAHSSWKLNPNHIGVKDSLIIRGGGIKSNVSVLSFIDKLRQCQTVLSWWEHRHFSLIFSSHGSICSPPPQYDELIFYIFAQYFHTEFDITNHYQGYRAAFYKETGSYPDPH